MCGITGWARHPESGEANLDLAIEIGTELLRRNEVRGHHATGIAAIGGSNPFLLKRAVESSKFIASALYKDTMAAISADTSVLLGHTRHASHANGHVDEAAHPFEDGPIVGVHNGVIYNWRAIETKLRREERTPLTDPYWINDSQAAFALLSRVKDPVKALDSLDGWWALAWTKGKSLFFTRTQIELSAAYVGSMKTLFWSSDGTVLRSVLDAAGVGKYDLWLFKSNTVYRYEPKNFTETSANGVKRDAPFRGINHYNRTAHVNGANPTSFYYTNRPTGTSATTPPTGYSVTRTYPSGRQWDSRTAREYDDPDTLNTVTPEGNIVRRPKIKEPKATKGMQRAESEMDRVWDVIGILNTKLMTLRAEMDVLKAENDHLYAALNEKKPEVFDLPSDESPYADGPSCGQLDLMDMTECRECHQTDNEPKLPVPGGEFVHEDCVLSTLT